ncbi:MAG: hypothetical protein F9K16_02595 [Thermoanaerobaculia bacterium]|nr:MAG: hypothetical protein F9K16_02595 [Thermoanaerobaculia bacterium]MBZ0100753.1 hypothetical protein [Thermoanaerobaculia bacterium]
MDGFDPTDPLEYERLRRQSRRDAAAEGADPSLGEDALQDVLAQIAEGDPRPALNERVFRTCVRNRLKDGARRDRKSTSLDQRLFPEGDPTAVDRRLLLLGLIEHHSAEAPHSSEEALRSGLAQALAQLGDNYRQAVKAQILGWLEQSGGREEVEAFERHWGVALGPYSGYVSLASALGQKPATVASWAHRGMSRLALILTARP